MLVQHQQNLKTLVKLQKRIGPFKFDQFDDQVKKDLANDPTSPPATYALSNDDGFFNAARLAYLGFNLGLPVEDWSMSFRPTVDFEAGRHNLRELLPIFTQTFLDKDKDKDKDLTFSTDSHLGVAVKADQCKLLRKKSLEALACLTQIENNGTPVCQKSAEDSAPSSTIAKNFMNIASKVDKNSASLTHLVNVCMSCHVYGTTAPHISFNDSSILKEEFKAPSKTHPKNSLFKEMLDQIRTGGMPPNIDLAPEEKSTLIEYLKKQSSSN